MRVSVLILLVVTITALGVRSAEAEKVKTNQSTKVYAGPGEQKKVLLKVKSGQNMTLLEQEGRWLKVRVQGRTGYVPRSKVDMADDGEIARNTRRRPFVDGRSRKRGFGGEAGPEDRVGADATGGNDEGDSGEDEEEEAPKKPAKKAVKASEDDEEEETPKKPVKASKSSDDEEEAPKKPAKKPAKEEEDEEPAPKKASKSSDEEESSDDEEAVDDEKTSEPEEDSRPKARVAKKAGVFEEADSESEKKFTASPNEVLYPVESKGKWTAVENEEGDFGWIETEYLDMDGGGGGGPPGKRTIALGARVGLMIIQQAMRTTGSQNLKVPDNYNIGTSSVTLSLGGLYIRPFKQKYLIGAEATYDYSNTLLGGITYDPDGAAAPMPAVVTKVALHNINVRGMFGKDFKRKSGLAVFGRLGYRYQSYLVDGYSDPAVNPAKIPQEVIKGPTFGVALAMPMLTQKIGLQLNLDAILFGASLVQTQGLEDGSAPTLKAITAGMGVTYKFKKKLDLQANYDLRYTGIDFGPPLMTSTRGHMGNNITRTDIFHMVTFGVVRPF